MLLDISGIINKSYSTYLNSCEDNQLSLASNELNKVMVYSLTNASNKKIAEYSSYLIELKRVVLKLMNNSFYYNFYLKVETFINNGITKLEQLQYNKTLDIYKKAQDVLKNVSEIMKQYNYVYNLVFDSLGNRNIKDSDLCDELINNLTNLKEEVSLNEFSIFPKEVVIDNLKDYIINKIESLIETLNEFKINIIEDNDLEFINKYVKPLDNFNYGIVPIFNPKELRIANVIVLSSPFINEAKLMVSGFARNNNKNVACYSASIFEDMTEEDIVHFFDILNKKNIESFITDFEKYYSLDNFGTIIINIINYTRNNHYAFIYNESGNTLVYNNALKVLTKKEGYSSVDISHYYLSMPSYNELISLFVNNGMIKDEDINTKNRIRTYMPYMGFIGINEVIDAYARHKDFIAVGKKISNNNMTEKLEEYIKNLSVIYQLVDEGWDIKDTSSGGDVDTHFEFDYDDIKDINQSVIKRIVESDYLPYEKCGLVTKYCLLHGDDVSIWSSMSLEEKSNRIEQATKLVYKVLELPTIPVVKVLDQLKTKGAGGLCIDGGKEIHYKKSCIEDYLWTAEAICHESFHTFEHFCVQNKYRKIWWHKFGITEGMIARWRLNFQAYIGIDENHDAYLQQVVEAFSFSFEKDCSKAAEELWSYIDFS